MIVAYWAWARDGSAMHAWPLTEIQVQQAKRAGTEHETLCDQTLRIGERPVQSPRIQPEQNHCSACWSVLHPPAQTPFIAALVLPDLPPASAWRRSG